MNYMPDTPNTIIGMHNNNTNHGMVYDISTTFIINPRRMREGYGSRSVCVCVCVSVCYHASCYIPG